MWAPITAMPTSIPEAPEGQGAAGQAGDQGEQCELIDAGPKGDRGNQLHVAAADQLSGEQHEAEHEHRGGGA